MILEFLYGDKAAAAEYFVKLRLLVERLGKADQPLYSDTMETFVGMRIGEVLAIDVSNLRQFLDAMLRRAMMEGLAKGNLEVFNRYLGVAFRAYDRRYSASDPQAKFVLEESKLLPFPKLVENSFQSVMRQDSLPVMLRARIWAWRSAALAPPPMPPPMPRCAEATAGRVSASRAAARERRRVVFIDGVLGIGWDEPGRAPSLWVMPVDVPAAAALSTRAEAGAQRAAPATRRCRPPLRRPATAECRGGRAGAEGAH